MHKKLFAMLLAAMIVLCLGSAAVFAEGDPDPPAYMDATQANTFSLPIRFSKNQTSSVSPETTIYLDCLVKTYYNNPSDDTPFYEPDITFPNITVSNITFDEGDATMAGTVKNAVFNIPAVTKTGIYEYIYSVVSDNDCTYPDGNGDIKLKVYVFNSPAGKQMAVLVSVQDVTPVEDPITHELTWPERKIEELDVEYKAYEYSVEKEVAGNLGDRDKEFDFTVKLEGTWYKAVYPGATDHNEANGYPHVTISYSGGSASGSFNLGSEVVTQSSVYGENTYYTHSFEKEITLSLKHGEKVTFKNLPETITITATEDDYSADGYVTTIDGDEKRTESYTVFAPEPVIDYTLPEPAPVVDPVTGNIVYRYGNESVTVVNTKNKTVDTGVILDNLPYIISIAAVIVCGVVILIVKKRRKSDEDEENYV